LDAWQAAVGGVTMAAAAEGVAAAAAAAAAAATAEEDVAGGATPAAWALPLSESARQAFLLGCQGPDPFFFAVLTPDLATWRKLGSRMHAELVQQSLDSLRDAAAEAPAEMRDAMQAYVRGWLCHFTLDSLAHPYVFCFERALCATGVPGLDASARQAVHAQIESDLDASLLRRRRGQGIREFKPTTEVLLAADGLLAAIGRLYQVAADAVFSTEIPRLAYRRSVKDMRLSYEVLYSPDGVRRGLVGQMERMARPHSLAQALSHRVDVGPASDFDNPGREPWANPFTGEEWCSSFADIFDDAVALAAKRQLLYTDAATAADLVGTLNFEGDSIR
jgi:hypothetical protein